MWLNVFAEFEAAQTVVELSEAARYGLTPDGFCVFSTERPWRPDTRRKRKRDRTEYNRERYRNNKDEILAKQRAKRAALPPEKKEEILAKNREYLRRRRATEKRDRTRDYAIHRIRMMTDEEYAAAYRIRSAAAQRRSKEKRRCQTQT